MQCSTNGQGTSSPELHPSPKGKKAESKRSEAVEFEVRWVESHAA